MEKHAVDVDEPLIGVPEMARRLSVSRSLAWRLVRDGELPVVRIGRRLLLDPADVREYVEARKRRPERDDGPEATGPLVESTEARGGAVEA